jgi:hypothetical protein
LLDAIRTDLRVPDHRSANGSSIWVRSMPLPRKSLPSALTRSRCQPLYSGFPGAPFRAHRGARRPLPHRQHRPQRRRRCAGDSFRG